MSNIMWYNDRVKSVLITPLKQTIKKLFVVGIVLICVAINAQYLPLHTAVAAVKVESPVQVSAAVSSVQPEIVDLLQVVSVVGHSTITPTTIQTTAQPVTLDSIALQSTATVESVDVAQTKTQVQSSLAVKPLTILFSLGNTKVSLTIQMAISSTNIPNRDQGLPVNSEYSSAVGDANNVAFEQQPTVTIAISKEVKSLAVADKNIVLRC